MAATVVAIVGAVGVVLVFLVERRAARRATRDCGRLVARYCDFVVGNESAARAGLLASVENWHQKVHIQPNGDVREVVVLEAVAERDEVYFIRFHLGSDWDQPEKYRRNVLVNADNIEIDGRPTRHWSMTNSWLSNARLTSIVHFHSPVRMGQVVRMEMTRFWPAKCLPLMRRGAAEQFVFRATELLRVRHLEYQVRLPSGFDARYEPVGFTPPDNRISVGEYTDVGGRRVFICRVTELPEQLTVGMRLALA
ncbi:hypothetical protein [Actinophytocola glycyrrhizae]|uniref:DUF4178 domain-containing protein n=1 Tax=Actinophytocola glycyrrhizae TaxID=2044873 RepID=A0ABV9RYX2_9PSEU